MRKSLCAILLFIIIITPVLAQEKNDHEISSEVKELAQFHKVIYKIWHTGWPQKDIVLLSSLAPEVEAAYEKVKNTELPGILRDRKTKWNEAVTTFGVCVDLYKVASLKKDSVSLLNAAEKLHAQFETMIRIVKPPLKEVEEFHQVLYMLYHHYMPDSNFDLIKESALKLKAKIDPMKKAVLPERLKSKEQIFVKSVDELSLAVDKLNEVAQNEYDKKSVNSAVEKVHTKYEVIDKIFE